MDWSVDPRAAVPPSQQLVAVALDAIASGELTAGDRLPSVRALASEALVNPNTVGKAYRELELLGAVEGRNGSGVYVTDAGKELAQARRLGETLGELQAAARFALRAGHDATALHRCVEGAAHERAAKGSKA